MRVAVVSIMKNEEQFIKRWADSCADAEYRILLDTGSSDNSVQVAKDCGVIVHEQIISPWHFAKARNHLLDLIPEDVDWIINLDVDEVLGRGWYDALRGVPTDGSVNRPRYLYTWNWEEKIFDGNVVDHLATIERGKPGLQYHGDKITGRFSHRWKHPVHEVNITQEGYEERQAFCDVRIYHFADDTKPRSQYLPLLIQAVEEDPECDRNTYYCARELFFYGRHEEAIKMFKRHLTMPRSTWPPERGFSMRYLAKMLPEEKEAWLLRACAEYPWGRETWLELAQHYYNQHDWISCLMAADKALRLTERGQLYLTEAWAWGWMGHDLAAISSHHLGLHKQALKHGQDALEHAPNDERLNKNMFFYRNATSKIDVVIPHKSNRDGLDKLIAQLTDDTKVGKIIVVTDGTEGSSFTLPPEKVTVVAVKRGVGIHKMWNLGLSLADADSHVAFINDDVSLAKGCMSTLCAVLDEDPTIGLVSPHYADAPEQPDIECFTTCRGRYDGSGGMAGFCMVLSNELTKQWKFDEQMIWWYGDDDLVNWVNKVAGRKCVLTSRTYCRHAHSQTIENDPPENFAVTVNNDKKIFEKKWSN